MCLSADLPHHSNNVVGIKMWFHPRQELLMLILMMAALWQLGLVWHCSHFPLIRHLTQGLSLLSSCLSECCDEVDTSSWGKIVLQVIFAFHLYVQIHLPFTLHFEDYAKSGGTFSTYCERLDGLSVRAKWNKVVFLFCFFFPLIFKGNQFRRK